MFSNILLPSLLLMAISSMADVTVDTIVTQLATGHRKVLLFTKLPTHFLLIVGSPGAMSIATTIWDETFLFDQKLETMSDSAVLLKKMQHITIRWPAVISAPYNRIFAVGGYLVMVRADDSSVDLLNITTGIKSSMPLYKGQSVLLQTVSLLLSSYPPEKSAHFFYYATTDRSQLTKNHFDKFELTEATTVAGTVANRIFCKPGAGTTTTTSAQNANDIDVSNSGCQQPATPVTWNIIAGGVVDGNHFTLFEANNSVITFDGNIFDEKLHQGTVHPRRVPANFFWQSDDMLKVPSDGGGNASMTTNGKSHHTVIIFATIVVIICLILAVFIYVYTAPPKENSLAADQAASFSAVKVDHPRRQTSVKQKSRRRRLHVDSGKGELKSNNRMPTLGLSKEKVAEVASNRSNEFSMKILCNPKMIPLAKKKPRHSARRASSRKRATSKRERKKRRRPSKDSKQTKN